MWYKLQENKIFLKFWLFFGKVSGPAQFSVRSVVPRIFIFVFFDILIDQTSKNKFLIWIWIYDPLHPKKPAFIARPLLSIMSLLLIDHPVIMAAS